MKISTKGRYGVRLMTELGLNYSKSIIPLKEIAISQDISQKYLEQIINQLNKAGLVKSIRGSQGGYTLSRAPEKISLGQILKVLEGSMAPVSCLEYDGDGCERAHNCSSLPIWKELDEAIHHIIDKYTLADIVSSQAELNSKLDVLA